MPSKKNPALLATRSRAKSPAGPQALPSNKPPTAPPAPPRPRTPAEQALVNEWRKRGNDPQLPQMTVKETDSRKELLPATSDPDLWIAQVADLLKTDHPRLFLHLLYQGAHCVWKTKGEEALNLTIAALAGISPRDPLEVLLAMQMVSVHNVAMELLRRTMIPDQTIEGVTVGVQRATALLRTFTAQMETLIRYRGGGQQTVTVQHVQVDAGGQAIVGTVHHGPSRPGGEGDEGQK